MTFLSPLAVCVLGAFKWNFNTTLFQERALLLLWQPCRHTAITGVTQQWNNVTLLEPFSVCFYCHCVSWDLRISENLPSEQSVCAGRGCPGLVDRWVFQFSPIPISGWDRKTKKERKGDLLPLQLHHSSPAFSSLNTLCCHRKVLQEEVRCMNVSGGVGNESCRLCCIWRMEAALNLLPFH